VNLGFVLGVVFLAVLMLVVQLPLLLLLLLVWALVVMLLQLMMVVMPVLAGLCPTHAGRCCGLGLEQLISLCYLAHCLMPAPPEGRTCGTSSELRS
jgi:hypothetical protein